MKQYRHELPSIYLVSSHVYLPCRSLSCKGEECRNCWHSCPAFAFPPFLACLPSAIITHDTRFSLSPKLVHHLKGFKQHPPVSSRCSNQNFSPRKAIRSK